MARKSRTAVLKRQREAKKAEKAAMKREKRELRVEDDTGGQVATADDLAGYGFDSDDDEAEEPETPA
jgi:phosphopantothenoylcysteine synthetase/decarboxylase